MCFQSICLLEIQVNSRNRFSFVTLGFPKSYIWTVENDIGTVFVLNDEFLFSA